MLDERLNLSMGLRPKLKSRFGHLELAYFVSSLFVSLFELFYALSYAVILKPKRKPFVR